MDRRKIEGLKRRTLMGNTPFDVKVGGYTLLFPVNAGMLFVPKPVFVYKIPGDVDMKQAEKLMKYDAIERIVHGIENGWEEELNRVYEKDLYITAIYEDRDKGDVFYINYVRMGKEFEDFIEHIMGMKPGEEEECRIYYSNKEKGFFYTTTMLVRQAESIEDALDKMERTMKDIAFSFPESFALAKKVVE